MCHFQWPWTKPNPVFKVTPLFGSKYLTNGYRYGQSYYRRRIGNRTQAFEWHQLQWPWVTSKPHFNTGTLLVHCWYSLGRHVTIGTPMVILLFWLSFDCFWLFFTIGTPFVHCLYSLGRPVTIGTPMVLGVFDDWFSVPFVKNSQKTVKIATITIGVLIVTCQRRVRRIHKAAQTPLPCETSIICAGWLKLQDRTMTDNRICRAWHCRTGKWRTN